MKSEGNEMKNNQEALPDEELVLLAQQEDKEAMDWLLQRYKEWVRGKARLYYMMGSDTEDVIQEGMMGLFKAIRSFDPEKEASFRTFAEICVHRQIVDAIRGATRRKHSPLNESVSLDKPVEEGEEKTLRDLLKDPNVNLEERVIFNEEWEALFQQAKTLFSPLEWLVWNEYMNGKSKNEIAWATGHSGKSIDNALQRMKRKLMKYLKKR